MLAPLKQRSISGHDYRMILPRLASSLAKNYLRASAFFDGLLPRGPCGTNLNTSWTDGNQVIQACSPIKQKIKRFGSILVKAKIAETVFA